MKMNKKMLVLGLSTVLALSATALATRQQGTDDPAADQASINAEEQYRVTARNRDSAEKALFTNLTLAGDLIIDLPAWSAGNIPSFDSYWTSSQMQAQLGRPLTADEATDLATLNALPYRIKTSPTLVGMPRDNAATVPQVFNTSGTMPSDKVTSAGLDSGALPVITSG